MYRWLRSLNGDSVPDTTLPTEIRQRYYSWSGWRTGAEAAGAIFAGFLGSPADPVAESVVVLAFFVVPMVPGSCANLLDGFLSNSSFSACYLNIIKLQLQKCTYVHLHPV